MVDEKKPQTSEKPHGLAAHPLKDRRRRFVVVMDDTKECNVALHFAALRAAHVKGGNLVLFHVIPPAEFQHWMAVEDRMREESFEEARLMMKEVADRIRDYVELAPEVVIRQGNPKDELKKFLEEEEDIFALFLGANTEGDPGPLVSYFAGQTAGCLHCPVVIVPGCLEIDEIEAIA